MPRPARRGWQAWNLTSTPGDEPLDPMLGQPRMVADPRISVDQAAQVLGKTSAQVTRMIKLGRLPRRGEPNKFRGLLLSDVLRCRNRGEPIDLGAAAKLLRCAKGDIRQLIADGKLALVPGTQRRVYETDVRELASAGHHANAPVHQPHGPTATSTQPRPRRSSAPASDRRNGSRPPNGSPACATVQAATGTAQSNCSLCGAHGRPPGTTGDSRSGAQILRTAPTRPPRCAINGRIRPRPRGRTAADRLELR